MPTWIRDYKCGCVPEEEHFCKTADPWVWAERQAVMDWSGIYGEPTPEQDAHFEQTIQEARRHLNVHFQAPFQWIDLDSIPEPPDDGYDEDPRVVGYPS